MTYGQVSLNIFLLTNCLKKITVTRIVSRADLRTPGIEFMNRVSDFSKCYAQISLLKEIPET